MSWSSFRNAIATPPHPFKEPPPALLGTSRFWTAGVLLFYGGLVNRLVNFVRVVLSASVPLTSGKQFDVPCVFFCFLWKVARTVLIFSSHRFFLFVVPTLAESGSVLKASWPQTGEVDGWMSRSFQFLSKTLKAFRITAQKVRPWGFTAVLGPIPRRLACSCGSG